MATTPASSQKSVLVKVGMVGDSQVGKTSLMVKYVEGSFDEDFIQTLGECPLSSCGAHSNLQEGVNFMEKRVSVRGTTVTFSIWDLGGLKGRLSSFHCTQDNESF